MANEETQAGNPRHVAIIMDGNGRWAKARNLPRSAGHRAGVESIRTIVKACAPAKVMYLTLYAFSTENWQRPPSEIRELMRLLNDFLEKPLDEVHEQGIRIRAIGELQRLPRDVRRKLDAVLEKTRNHRCGNLTLCLSYGARTELAGAARKLAEQVQAGVLKPEQITEALFAAQLQTADIPDPDLIIRTAGEMRLSNFLLWQASYAELYVTQALWPDFDEAEFAKALAEYRRRRRRFGNVDQE